jgi:hypothetical protein
MTSLRHSFFAIALLVFIGGFAFVQAAPSGGGGAGCGSSSEVFSCWDSGGNNIPYITIPFIGAGLTANPQTINQGEGTTLTWLCTEMGGMNEYVAATNNFNPTAGGNGGSVTLYPTVTTTYTSTCNGNLAPGIPQSVTVTVLGAYSDLSVSAIGATQTGTTLQGVITGTVSNGGAAGTGANFTTVTEIDNDNVHGAVYDTVSRTTTALSAGAQANVDINYTYPSYATWYYRTCTDTGSAIGESSEGNNCTSWQTITLTPPALPDVTASQVQMTQVSGTLNVLLQSVISNVGNAPTNQ